MSCSLRYWVEDAADCARREGVLLGWTRQDFKLRIEWTIAPATASELRIATIVEEPVVDSGGMPAAVAHACCCCPRLSFS